MKALGLPLPGFPSGGSPPDRRAPKKRRPALNGPDGSIEVPVERGQPLRGASRANRLGPEFGPEFRPEFGPESRRENWGRSELLSLVQTVVQSRVEVRVQCLGARSSLPADTPPVAFGRLFRQSLSAGPPGPFCEVT